MQTDGKRSPLSQIPTGIWILGFVSLLMDVSSEMIHSLLPMFMVTTMGASALEVGIIEGLAESIALIARVFSGPLSDYLGRRKGLVVLGYSLAAVSKPMFAIAPGIGTLFSARMLDRIGKGFVVRPVMHWWLTSPRRCCAGLRLACDNRLMLWEPFSGRCLR
ncbi:MFS transporter [uncultured Amphritea sp.]|uniref:MFS transporter n=1 Tax=uncultured Amphritea sp. TaxID=981605 RepID=UPI0025D32BD9|nr:MFS transporter [uncultured Amphritea sp.]